MPIIIPSIYNTACNACVCSNFCSLVDVEAVQHHDFSIWVIPNRIL